jgi:Gram-negative bacterial TonB protein C-terminal
MSVLVAPIIAGAMRSKQFPQPQLESHAARDTVDCLDTLHASDSITVVVTMSVKPQDRRIALPADFEGLFVQEFRSRLKVPGNLPLSVMQGWGLCTPAENKCSGGALVLGTHAFATAQPGGTLSRIAVIDFALTPALSESVRAALEMLSDDKIVPLIAGSDSIPLEMFILVAQKTDTIPIFRHLFRARIPYYVGEFTAAQWPKDARGPRYPRIAEQARAEDSLEMNFTIRSDGTVIPETLEIRSAHYREFIRAVFDRMATIHYVPARIGSCPVPSWISQNFVFRMR